MLKLAGELIEGQLADHMAELEPHPVETLPVLLKGGNLLHIPTNAGWGTSHTGSGGSSLAPFMLNLWTGTTANSRALLNTQYVVGFSVGGDYRYLNYDKKLYIIFNLNSTNNDVEGVVRFQIKDVLTEGALEQKGVGIRLDNLALKGESFGTSLGVIVLTTLTVDLIYQIVIILYPGSKIEWYVNGVLVGTQSTAANIPTGVFAASMVFSAINGATGGVNINPRLMHPKIWQEI